MPEQHLFTSQTINHQTGELIISRKITRKSINTAHFVKLFIDDLSRLKDLAHSEHRMLIHLAKYITYGDNTIYLGKDRRQELADVCQLKMPTVNQGISRLVQKGLLIKKDVSLYQMDPNIFFSGDDLQRAKVMELTIRYEIKGDSTEHLLTDSTASYTEVDNMIE